MIQYILVMVAFQLLFLVTYDLFLKRETFFQWNRAYLIGTFLLSLVLPFVKLDMFTTVVAQEFSAIVLPEVVLTADALENTTSVQFSWVQIIFMVGVLLALAIFAYKIFSIIQLKKSGRKQRFSDFIKVVVPQSNIAFSFYRTIFLGDKVSKKDEEGILQHELVHIKQKHTLDLLFFELMRIVFWFNPLVYVYQSRISELHEFIADAKVSKNDKKAQYELLLSQIFQTKNISFINHFFKSSLIKKRIVMLQKSKSKQILKFKYVLMLPLIIGMLFYTSCETEETIGPIETIVETEMIDEVVVTALSSDPNKVTSAANVELIEVVEEVSLSKAFDGENDVPFSVVEEAPVFPGCENAENKHKCFNEQIQRHIRKNFRYPEEVKEKGIQGRVSVMFIIQEDGSIGNVRMRGPSKILEAEAERIISKLPNMVAGKQRGKSVRVPFFVPITFKLQ